MLSDVRTRTCVSLEAATNYLASLDFSYLIDKVCDPDYPLPRWVPVEAQHGVRLYKRFLWLLKRHEGVFLVPSYEIDEFWHNHILHTKRYCADSQAIFGYYLHHEPASKQEDPCALIDGYRMTQLLYEQEFGIPLKAAPFDVLDVTISGGHTL